MENDTKNEYMPRETFGVGLALGGCLTLLPIQANILGVALATSQVLIQEVPSVYDCLSVVYLCHVPLSYYE